MASSDKQTLSGGNRGLPDSQAANITVLLRLFGLISRQARFQADADGHRQPLFWPVKKKQWKRLFDRKCGRNLKREKKNGYGAEESRGCSSSSLREREASLYVANVGRPPARQASRDSEHLHRRGAFFRFPRQFSITELKA